MSVPEANTSLPAWGPGWSLLGLWEAGLHHHQQALVPASRPFGLPLVTEAAATVHWYCLLLFPARKQKLAPDLASKGLSLKAGRRGRQRGLTTSSLGSFLLTKDLLGPFPLI